MIVVLAPYADRMSERRRVEKRRVTTSVDADLVEAGRAVVAAGGAESFSAWVSSALRRQVEHDRRLRALDDFLAGFEAEHGAITDEEMHDAARRARARAVVVRGLRSADAGTGPGRGGVGAA